MLHYFITLLIILSNLLAVGESSAIFLLISPSPLINGLGGSGVSFISNDIYSSYFNPAHSTLPNGFSYTSSKMTTNWLPNLADDLILINNTQRISYSKYPISNFIWMQFSITKLETNLNLGQILNNYNGNQDNSYMSCSAITYSVGVQSKIYPIFFSIGRTNKTVTQYLESENNNEYSWDELYDWGSRFFISNYPLLNDKIGLTLGIGYSKSNIGDFIWFQDVSQGDPAPTTARLGMTWGGKFELINGLGIEIKLIHEAEDLLVETIGDKKIYKGSLLGEIDFNNHILSSDAEEDVTIHRGMEMNFFDIYFLREGRLIDIDGKINITTKGNSINYTNIIKLFLKTINTNNSYLNNLTKYISYQKSYSTENEEVGHPRDNITYREHTITLKNINELIYKILK